MKPKKTHREVKDPQMNAKLLADFMDATDIARGTILRNARYQPIGPIVQHDEAKPIVANFLRLADAKDTLNKSGDSRERRSSPP